MKRTYCSRVAGSFDRALWVVCILLSVPVALEAQESKVDQLVQQGAAHVREGAFGKAVKSFERANELSGGESMPALVGLAMAYNGNGQPDQALPPARQVVEVSDSDQWYWLGLGELALALASSSGELSTELQGAFDALRGLLAEVPNGSVPNRLRQRLCWSRGVLPADSPEALGRGEGQFSRDEVRAAEPGLEPPRQIFSETISVSRDQQRRLGDEEEAVFRAVIDVDGCVLGAEIIDDSNDVWTELAFAAMRRYVFEPARLEDQPVKAFLTLRFDYPTPFQ